MLGALYSVTRVIGGDLLLLIWGICTEIYLVCGFVRRKERGRKGRYQLLIGLLISEVLVDIVFFPTFFPGGEYHNWGVGSVSVVGLWPAALLATYAITAVFGRGEA